MNQDLRNQAAEPVLTTKISSTSNSEEVVKINRQLSRVQKREIQKQIPIEAVMQIFNSMNNQKHPQEEVYLKKHQRKQLNKKSSQNSQARSKKGGRLFNNLSQKTLNLIDDYTSKYRASQSSNGNIFDPKTGSYKVQLFRYVMIGIFQLRQLAHQPKNDLSARQKNIAAEDTDIFQWNRRIIQEFDKQFKMAQFQKRLGTDLKKKWEVLLSHCKDETNQTLRRALANRTNNAKRIINMTQDDLMSKQAKRQRDRQLKNILRESEIDFEKQTEQQMKLKQKAINDQKETDQEPQEQIPQLNNSTIFISSANQQYLQQNPQHEKENQTEKEKQNLKIMEYIEMTDKNSLQRIKNRIIEDLNHTQSFSKLYDNYIKVFGQCSQTKHAD